MRTIGVLVAAVAVVFLGVMGYFYVTRGSLEEAGAQVDTALEKVDKSTQPIQDEVKDLGDATKKSVDRATDNDDRT